MLYFLLLLYALTVSSSSNPQNLRYRLCRFLSWVLRGSSLLSPAVRWYPQEISPLTSVHLAVLRWRAQHETNTGTVWGFTSDRRAWLQRLTTVSRVSVNTCVFVFFSPPQVQNMFSGSSSESSPQPEKITIEDLTEPLPGIVNRQCWYPVFVFILLCVTTADTTGVQYLPGVLGGVFSAVSFFFIPVSFWWCLDHCNHNDYSVHLFVLTGPSSSGINCSLSLTTFQSALEKKISALQIWLMCLQSFSVILFHSAT